MSWGICRIWLRNVVSPTNHQGTLNISTELKAERIQDKISARSVLSCGMSVSLFSDRCSRQTPLSNRLTSPSVRYGTCPKGCLRAAILEGHVAHAIAQSGLFAGRPAKSQVTHIAPRPLRHPIEGPDRQSVGQLRHHRSDALFEDGLKLHHIMRRPSNGMSISCQRGSVGMLARHWSWLSLLGQITPEKRTVSPSRSATARRPAPDRAAGQRNSRPRHACQRPVATKIQTPCLKWATSGQVD